MGLQKPWRWLAGLIAAMLLIAAAFYFWWKSPKINDIQWIPENADIVLTVNTREWIEAAIQAGSKTDIDSGRMKSSIQQSGINALSPFWLFVSTNNQKICGAFELDKPELTAKFLKDNLHATRAENSDIWQHEEFEFLIKKNWLYVFYNGISTLVSADKSELFFKNSQLLKNRFAGEWMKGVFNPKILNKYSINIPAKSDITVSLLIEKSKIKLEFEGIELAQNKIDVNSWADFSFPVAWFGSNIQNDVKKQLKKQGIDTTDIFVRNTSVEATFFGIQNHTTSKISYAFDEEFNRVQLVSKMIKIIPSVVLQFQAKNNMWWQKTVADSVSKQNIKYLNIFGIPLQAKMLNENRAYIGNSNLQKSNNSIAGFMHINMDSFRNNKNKYNIPGMDEIPVEFKTAELKQENSKTIFTIGFSEYKNTGDLLFDLLNKAMKFNK